MEIFFNENKPNLRSREISEHNSSISFKENDKWENIFLIEIRNKTNEIYSGFRNPLKIDNLKPLHTWSTVMNFIKPK